MSSNIEIQRVCEYCKNIFTAKTTKTRFCSHKCNSRGYKASVKQLKMNISDIETKQLTNLPILDLQSKDYLSISQACSLIGISKRTMYRMIGRGEIATAKFGTRTIISRIHIDSLFKVQLVEKKVPVVQLVPSIEECYNIGEVQQKFNISSAALYNLIKRENINKFSKGKFTYIAKKDIEALF